MGQYYHSNVTCPQMKCKLRGFEERSLLLDGLTVKPSWFPKRIRRYVGIALMLTFLSAGPTALGQTSKPSASQSTQGQAGETPQDPLGRTTPRGTVMGFLSAAYSQKYDVAAQYLDSRTQRKDAAELAKKLFFVLDRRLPAKLNNVSNDPLGSMSDPFDSRRELIGHLVTENGGVDISLQRVDRAKGPPIWLFSRQTLSDIPGVYDEINAVSVENLLPDSLLRKYFGITLFGWLYFLIFLPSLYLILSLLSRGLGAALGYALRRWGHRLEMRNPTVLPHPIRLLIVSGAIFVTLYKVSLTLIARQTGRTIGILLLIVAFVWAMFLINGRCELYLKRRMERRGRLGSTVILRPARRVLDLVAIVIGLIFLLHTFGINPTAALAGLGVGGIAVALAAQKTLENVIGGASLIMDGAVRVGDTFKVGEVVGTIEAIGLRSTRVRTGDRTIVTIPNGQMATMTLENLSARDRFWFRQLISVEYQTVPTALSSLLVEVRTLLESDQRVIPETARVRFLRFAEFSLELEIVAYINAREWNHFLEIKEDLLIRIRELIASAGVAIAYPASVMYLKSETESDGAPWKSLRPGTDVAKEEVHETQSH